MPGALLSHQELIGARLDGLVFELGCGFIPADLPESDAARVVAVRGLVPPGYGICGPTAAWVLGYGDAVPQRQHFQRISPQRTRVPGGADVMLHDVRLPDADTELIAGVRVTTPVRTMVDLALHRDTHADYAPWLRAMAMADAALVAAAHAAITARVRMPGKRAALAVLDSLASERHDEVTRYTS